MLPMTGAARLRLLMTVDAVGGIWTYAVDLAAGLAARDVEVLLAVMGPPPLPHQVAAAARVPGLRLIDTGLPLEWLAASAAEMAGTGAALARLATEFGASVVQLNAPGPAADARFGVPLVIACHSCVATWWRAVRGGPMPEEFRWRAAMVARAYRSADLLVAPSAAFATATREAYGLGSVPQIVSNGRRQALPGATPPSRTTAFTAGRLWDEGKDATTLDRAAALLPFPVVAAGPVVGPNGAHVDLPHLHLLGQLSEMEVRRALAAGPIFASAARYEPFGLAVLEAAQAGCALVLAETPVFRELWGDAAIFVPVGDAEGFAAALRDLARDTEGRRAWGLAARERARRYSLDAQVDAMLNIYHHLRDRHAPAAREVAA